MSVLAGIWNLDGKSASRTLLQNISNMTARYGPDGARIHIDGSLGILYRASHTTREERGCSQPFTTPRGNLITWNGRLDNRDELIVQIEKGVDRNSSDSEIVGAAFDRWGSDCLSRIIGDWAVSIWMPRENALILARDYIGIKHLFYSLQSTRIIWSSHLEPLLLTQDRFTICEEYIAGFLASDPDAHLSPYNEITPVPPGKYIRVQAGCVCTGAHWTFNPGLKIRYKTDSEYEEHFRHLLRQSIRRRLRTDSPVLAELSGGLDSSSIVCIADDILEKEGAETPNLETLSAFDPNEPEDDDLIHFTIVERKRGRRGHRVDMQCVGDSLSFNGPEFLAAPGFDLRKEFACARLATINRGQFKVVLSGFGGDQLLGQTLDFRVQMADLLLALRLGKMSKQLFEWSLIVRRPWIQLLLQSSLLVLPTRVRVALSALHSSDSLINKTFKKDYQFVERVLTAGQEAWWWSAGKRNSLQTYRMMANKIGQCRPAGEDIRYPYLDQSLVEFLLSIPLDQLLRPGERRSLMRRALSRIVPPEILQRKTKGVGGRCLTVTAERHWEDLQSLCDSPLTSHYGYVDDASFRAALNDMRNGQISLQGVILLKVLSLEMWLRAVAARKLISEVHNSKPSHAQCAISKNS